LYHFPKPAIGRRLNDLVGVWVTFITLPAHAPLPTRFLDKVGYLRNARREGTLVEALHDQAWAWLRGDGDTHIDNYLNII